MMVEYLSCEKYLFSGLPFSFKNSANSLADTSYLSISKVSRNTSCSGLSLMFPLSNPITNQPFGITSIPGFSLVDELYSEGFPVAQEESAIKTNPTRKAPYSFAPLMILILYFFRGQYKNDLQPKN